MIEPEINEQLGSFAPSQRNADLLQNVVSQESLSMTETIMPRRSFVLPTAPSQPQLDPALKAAVDEMANQRSAVLNSSLYNATKKNPDAVAEAQRVAKQMGVGADIAERNLPELQRGAMMLKALDRNLAVSAPKTANSLTEPDFANIAYDDLENLTGTEKLMRWFAGTDFFKGAQGTFISTEMATIDQLNSEGMATSKDFERYKELQRDLQIVGQPAPYSISGNIANLLASVEAGAEIGAQYAVTGAVLGGAAGAIGGPLAPATMPAGMALGGTAGFATGMAKWMYQAMAGESYRQLREGDVSHEVALPMSRGIGVITSALEFAGLGAEVYIASGLGKKIFSKELATDVTAELSKQMIKKATASEAVWDASKLYFGEILTESTVEGLQTAITRVGTEIGRAYDRPDLQNMFQTPEGRRAIISEAVDSFVNVAIGMSVAGLPLPAANYYMDRGRYADAKRSQQFYEDLSKNAVDSKMRQRNPDAAERFYADQVDGTGAETTYVDGRVMQNILNQSGLTNEQLDTVLPGIRQQLAEAISIGGDVTIPTATYAARLAGTKLGDSMKIHMRPNANAWSADTAVKYAGQLEQEKEKALALLEEKETTDTKFVDEARVIEKDMREKLAAVGRDPKLAKAEATIFRDMMVVAAAEAKMTPAAYMAEHGPDVVGPQAQTAPFQQASRIDADYMAAVESGDAEMQQRMVEESATAAGFSTDKYFHTTRNLFSKFKTPSGFSSSMNELGIWVTKDKQLTTAVETDQYEIAAMRSDSINEPRLLEVFIREPSNPFRVKTRQDLDNLNPTNQSASVIKQQLIDQGFDGIIVEDDYGYGESRVVFNESDISIADPVVNDESGNIVTPSERFGVVVPGVLAQATRSRTDANYMAAVERGDMETAQRMVDEAAKDAGFNEIGTHGLSEGQLEGDTFDKQRLGSNTGAKSASLGFFFGSKMTAMAYAKPKISKDIQRQYATKLQSKWNELSKRIPKKLLRGFLDMPGTFQDELRRGKDAFFATTDINPITKEPYGESILEHYSSINDSINFFLEDIETMDVDNLSKYFEKTWLPEFGALLDEALIASTESALVNVRLKMNNPYVYDYKGAQYREKSYASIISKAKKNGHDSVILKNTYDGPTLDDIKVVFEPSQIKSADPITRDADGNVIPLSRRFNIASPSILEQAAKSDANAINEQAAQESDDTVATAESQPNIPTTIDDAISLDSVAKLATGRAWERGRDLKVEMQKEATTLASGSGVDLLIDTPQTTEYLTRVGLRDALYALRQNPNSVGWYDEKTRQALAVMALVHPEILTDENARFAFTWALAVTSNGIKVGKNFELAEMVYRRYKIDGKMPSDLAAGTSQEAINNSLSLFNTLRDAWGIDNLRRFAQTEYTIQELKYIVADTDSGGEYANTVVKGAAVLGPKIGNGFFSNLYGDFRSLTMDRWLVRTWGRWTGTLIMPMPVQTQNARTRLQTVITALTQDERASMASILREAVPKQTAVIDAVESGSGVDFDALSSVIQKASMDKEVRAKMNETFVGQEVRKAGNGLAKYLDGQKEAPAGPGERVRIRGIFATILQQLQQLPEYAELTMADLQAALWYAEKRLYETAKEDITIDEEDIEGYADDEAPDYANAAADVARVAGVSNEKISQTLQRESNNERSRQSRLQEKSGSPVEARNTAATRGFSDNEKRQFNGAAVIRNDRASRGNIAGSPDPYTRSSSKTNTKPRLVTLLRARVVSLFQPQGRLRNALKAAGGEKRPFDTPKFYELEKSEKSPIAFHRLITESKTKSEFGASVYAYTVEEYADMRLFVSEDALSGFALKGDDIVSVFSMSDAAVGHALMQMAVSVGGRRLDAFDTVLPYLYAPHGFRAVARLRWDEGRKPEGWDKKTFAKFNNGEPDVVFMVYDPTYFGQYSNKDGKVVKSEDAAVRVQKKATSNIANGGILEQAAPSPGPARGGYDPKRIQILLNSEADAFTFLHELMHWRMDKMIQSVNNGKASPQEIADLDIMIQSFKLGGESQQERLAIWNAMTFEEQRPHWEAIAYNFENYLFEGKAPSVEMQGVFDRMASFIKRVYVSIRDDLNKIYRREFGKDLPVLTDEVRGVMDRMLASEDQIKRKQAMMQMVPMFLTQEESGMDDATYAAYQAMNKEAEDAAVTDLTKASLKQMQWLSGARSRVLKEIQAKHDALRKEIRAEVKAEVDAEPIYAAMSILKTGEGRAKNGEMVKFDDKFKLNLESVKKMIPAEDVAKLGFGKYGMVAADGMDPDMAADMFGFSSGDELVLALLSAKPAKEEINARTDKRMMDENGDMNTPQSQEEAVQRALHNEARFRFNAVEVRWLSKATSPVRVFMDAAKLAAQQIIAGKVIRDLRPSEYQAAEAKAAREAADAHSKRRTAAQAAQAAATKERNAGLSGVAAGVPMSEVEAAAAAKGQEAAQKATERESERKARYGERTPEQVILRAKQIQLLQNQLAREAQDAKDEVSKGVKYLRNVLKTKNVQRMGADITDQVTNMLERFSLANISAKEAGKRLSLAKWIEGQLELGIVPDIDPKLLDESFRKPYQQMTVSEFRDLVSSIEQLEYLGKHENEIRLAGEKVQFVDARDAIVKSIQEEKKDGKKLNPRTATTKGGRALEGIRTFMAAHLKVAAIARIMDGGKDNGKVWSYFIRSANAAGDMETRMIGEATEKVMNILKPVKALGNMESGRIYFKSVDRSFNRGERFVIALNSGNEGNLQRMRDGEGWTMEQIAPVLESLSSTEWNAVQAIWNHFETYKPLVEAKERRLYGKAPNWIEVKPFAIKTSDGKTLNLEGGYYPIKYDPKASDAAEQFTDAEAAKAQMKGAFTAATTRRSYVKNRAERVVGRPLMLTMTGVYSGLGEVIHDLSWHEWLISANRMMKDRGFSSAVNETYGPEIKRQMKDWIKDVAAGQGAADQGAANFATWMRRSISSARLGFNATSGVMQISGLANTWVRIDGTLVPKWTAIGVEAFIRHPKKMMEMIQEKSSMMRNLGRTQFRDLNEIRNTMQDKDGKWNAIHANAYIFCRVMQSMVNYPTWAGAYEKSLFEGNNEDTSIALADQAVIDSQGGGQLKDLASVERGGAWSKLFTVFYGYQNALFNSMATSVMTQKKSTAAAQLTLLVAVPAVYKYYVNQAIKAKRKDDDDNEEKGLAAFVAEESIQTMLSSMVGIRELSNLAKFDAKEVRDYSGPSGLAMFTDITNVYVQTSQYEWDAAYRRALLNLAGDLFGIPAVQINRTVDGIQLMIDKNNADLRAPIFGTRR